MIALLSTSAGLDIAPHTPGEPNRLPGARGYGGAFQARVAEGRHGVVRDTAPIGRVGVLTLGTRGRGGPGEVLVRVRGGTETYLAWSDEPLARDATVLVIESRGARAVDVIEWDGAPDPGGEGG